VVTVELLVEDMAINPTIAMAAMTDMVVTIKAMGEVTPQTAMETRIMAMEVS